jgi:hypothetical protein
MVHPIPVITFNTTAGSYPTFEIIFSTGETYFKFLTCHGFVKSPPLTVYVKAFDLFTWISVLITTLLLTLALTANYFSLSLKANHFTYNQLTTAASTFTFYSVSVLLENGFGNLRRADQLRT